MLIPPIGPVRLVRGQRAPTTSKQIKALGGPGIAALMGGAIGRKVTTG